MTVVGSSLLPAMALLLVAMQLSCNKDAPPQPPLVPPDTTSHSFQWQLDTLGDGASSILRDVAIVNDTLVYAVGELYKHDSLGGWDPIPYNLARWNGTKWQMIRVNFYIFCGQPQTTPCPTQGLLAFSPTDIWITSNNSQVARWDGLTERDIFCVPGSTGEMWGTDSTSLYVVDGNGQVCFWNGQTWARLVSRTSANINDIWGVVEPNGQRTILLAASNRYSAGEKKLLSLNASGSVDSLAWSPGTKLNTVWFASKDKLFVGGDGAYSGTPSSWTGIAVLASAFTTRIRGTAQNDVVAVGAFGSCSHFNGDTWKTYPEVSLPGGSYEGLAVTKSFVVAVGFAGDRAVALRGRR